MVDANLIINNKKIEDPETGQEIIIDNITIKDFIQIKLLSLINSKLFMLRRIRHG